MNKMKRLIDIGITLSKEKDYDILLEKILLEMMDISSCDAGTLYILKDNALHFKVMVTKSMNVFKSGKESSKLPAVELKEENVCAYSAINNKLVNINDVYNAKEFDFSGPKKYDSMTGYHTKSMLVLPMENDKGEVIGIIQLINALDKEKIVSFNKNEEEIFLSLASLAAVTLTNMNYSNEVIGLLESFARVMSTAIDAKTPYNANHTKNMIKYCNKYLKYCDEVNFWKFTETQKRELLMGIWLHDIGKLVIPLEVMDKSSRLGNKIKDIVNRFEKVKLMYKIHLLENKINNEDYLNFIELINKTLEFIFSINEKGFINDETIKKIEQLQNIHYLDNDMKEKKLLETEEIEMLLIQKGTLSAGERKIIESHVVITERMLNEMTFSHEYTNTPFYARSHHELLNGKGYPRGLKEDEIPNEVRLITILDIFDALTARDRPYKAPMEASKAFEILNNMALNNQIDQRILTSFIDSRAWEE